MSYACCIDPSPAVADQPQNVAGWLTALRACVVRSPNRGGLERVLGGLSDAAERLAEEHAGLAEELLCVYEQLGVVFDVTRKLAGVQDEAGVVALFLESLGRSFQTAEVFAVRPRQAGGWRVQGGDRAVDARLARQLSVAMSARKVSVEASNAAVNDGSGEETMVGPVFSGEQFVCAIVLIRRCADPSVARGNGAGFHVSDMLVVESLTTFCGDLIRNHRLVAELREMSVTMVRSLVNAVDQKDEYTSGHSIRVGYYSTLLGASLGMSDADLQMLQWSALLHDVGKIGIRDDVLKKPGKLSPDEFDHIKEHPVRSHKVVQQVPQLANALDGVLHHHERYDGTGYPSGLAGEQIPLQARIIQIADVFDALTSTRSYRPPYEWREALALMEKEAGKTIDPRLQKTFDGLIRERLDGHPRGWERLQAHANCRDHEFNLAESGPLEA